MADELEKAEGTLLRGTGEFRGKLYFIRHDDLAQYEVGPPSEKSKAEKFIKRYGQAPRFSESRLYPIATVTKTNEDFHACEGQESDSE
jgi:hypothetical protein